MSTESLALSEVEWMETSLTVSGKAESFANTNSERCLQPFPRGLGQAFARYGGVQSEDTLWMAREHSILIHLPPLATLASKLER